MNPVSQRRERVAKLVGEHREEVILPTIRFAERFFASRRTFDFFAHARELETSADARQQLAWAERLHEVFISAGFQTLDARVDLTALGQYDGGQCAQCRVGTNRFEQREPV